ncbi:hypothetical protein, partial [Xenorhabdus innexi]|uniref:hypothetical protein n=1 Tax=Xenorhabdus innexi TaxID=290109 RepID=UPI001C94BC3C
ALLKSIFLFFFIPIDLELTQGFIVAFDFFVNLKKVALSFYLLKEAVFLIFISSIFFRVIDSLFEYTTAVEKRWI